MHRIILIGNKFKLSKKILITIRIINGIAIILWGIFFIRNYDFNPYELIFLSLVVLTSTLYISYIFIITSEKSNLSPKVKVDDSEILLRNSLWNKNLIIKWIDISSIAFQPYKIVIRSQDSLSSFSYETNAETSREIKQTIRDFAERKNVEVIGG